MTYKIGKKSPIREGIIKGSSFETLFVVLIYFNDEQKIPIDPCPIFLGIKLDPKLSFTIHLKHTEKRIAIKRSSRSAFRPVVLREIKGITQAAQNGSESFLSA
ncbi:hypothetical protein BpHYR1_022808 [Brachionus plicatilis]|uniref:Uncharacterized protein n=1 Tax=Brachionus plicatilis TaxID=10195 RepID=A0A3M7SYL9_BRAPC|nr:hypothetical protein BpHYR1_022808 [Brachionus plicatilis]